MGWLSDAAASHRLSAHRSLRRLATDITDPTARVSLVAERSSGKAALRRQSGRASGHHRSQDRLSPSCRARVDTSLGYSGKSSRDAAEASRPAYCVSSSTARAARRCLRFSRQPVVRCLNTIVEERIKQGPLREGGPAFPVKDFLEVADPVGAAGQGDVEPDHRPRATLTDLDLVDGEVKIACRRLDPVARVFKVVRLDENRERLRPFALHIAMVS
jgi:hypothetical protein